MNLVRERNVIIDVEGKKVLHWIVWCPGCDTAHLFAERMYDDSPGWEFNGDFDKPTWSPSLLVQSGNADGPTVCHSFVRDGVWQFLGDCTHSMANQNVPMVPLPDFLAD